MSQKGTIVLNGRAWGLRYYDTVLDADGKPVRKKCYHKLADDFLAPLNAGKVRPESTTGVAQFIEAEYLAWTERSKRPSTAKGLSEKARVALASPHSPGYARERFAACDGTIIAGRSFASRAPCGIDT